ncbi:TetR/AcrR family transcriptional regulator [Antrihabitans sp. YC2-6]|uniref:TetR/AcrR family transcriptional regulator n=1 Tax=Antrihabitans sp. YC2-6 TaxID=2799498 RepID=UPI0018F2824B|nr:TetR/AcrR family transcriptional regulator [Antrihabitans sp. YC2-6]MBJ8344391.1 TetR/AcrR family transcriptional regulator [Antrihabitans sp. YC2-6]
MTQGRLVGTLADPDPAVMALLADPDEFTQRILAAAVDQMAAVGWRRSTVEDVAKRAGIGRATVYRRFTTKDALTEAVLHNELRIYLAGSTAAVAGLADVGDRMAESTVYTLEYVRNHRLIQRLLDTEPEAVLPALTTSAGPLVETIREFILAVWKHELYEDRPLPADIEKHLRTVAELHIRIAISLLLTPQTAIDLEPTDHARTFARRYLAPMLDAIGTVR